MRLALAMGRTVRELEEAMGADEWADWLAFQAEYDLPDDFLVTGQLGALISGVVGGRHRPSDFAPYYRPERTTGNESLRAAFQFLRENGHVTSREPE